MGPIAFALSFVVERIAENLWVLRYPLRLLGVAIGRTVTVIQLASGKLVIHSTAPFTPADVAAIHALGEPGWLLDATRFHDSHSRAARAAFPEVPYLAPEGFPDPTGVNTTPLLPAPAEWSPELEVIELEGMPKVREHVFFHQPSRTLIVGDLLFNFGRGGSAWTRFFARRVMRLKKFLGMSPFFRLMIRDRDAFRRSVGAVMGWDFDRVIVGHGEMIERDGKERLREVLVTAGVAPPEFEQP